MLVRSLERTGGPEEDGVRMFKDELRDAVVKKNANRLGDFEDDEFYLVSTLCDPRCFLNQVALLDLLFSTNLVMPWCRKPLKHVRVEAAHW